MTATVWIVVEFPDVEAAQAARLSGVTVHSSRQIRNDETTIVYRGEIDGETSEVAVGCTCSHGLHRVIELAGVGCLHPGCNCMGFFYDTP
jgi:hypothetical protein